MMNIAYGLITVGFLFAAYQAALDPETVNWFLFAPGIGLGVVGVVMLRRARRAAAHDETAIATGRQALISSLDTILEHARALEQERPQMPPDALPGEIDRRLRADLTRFADARETMIPLFGLQTYAAVMDAFAGGERYLNRVWSSATDGYHDEAADYLSRAVDRFRQADEIFHKAAGGRKA